MNDAASAPALRPRSAPQLFDAILALARRHAWDLFVLSVLLHLPVHVFRIAGAFAGSGSLIARLAPEQYTAGLWWRLWNSLAVTATAVAACQVYVDGSMSVRRALAGMRAGGWRLLGTMAAFDIAVDGLFGLINEISIGVVFFIAFAAALPWCAPAIPAAAVERIAPWAAIRRALWLVRRNFWRVAIVVWIVWSVTYFADGGIVNLAFSLTHRATVSDIIDLVVDGALYPLRGIALAVVYFDCRIRREAYDLERLMHGG